MTRSLRDQLKNLGVSGKGIRQFDVYTIADDIIAFPEERLDQRRKKHKKRFVIVLQNNHDNDNPLVKIIIAAPLSTKLQHHRLDYLLKKTDLSFLPADSYIRMMHTQPILKVDLKNKWGNIAQSEIRDHIRDRLFELFNL